MVRLAPLAPDFEKLHLLRPERGNSRQPAWEPPAPSVVGFGNTERN
jgi:hypothetical protein